MATATESSPSSEPTSVFGRLEDEAWLRVLVNSIDQPVVEGVTLPGFPPAEFQALSIGSSGERALTEAFGFWRIVKAYAARAGVSMSPGTRVLDFGCGWGRMVRFFLKDLRTDDVWGVDVANAMLSFCHQLFPYGHFEQVPPSPPTTLPASTFDAISAYSVFSHLNEPVHLAWVEEFSRILRPGGILVATTQGRTFLDFCEKLRRDGNPTTGWHEALAKSFIDLDTCLAAYDRGEFLHAATGGGGDRPAAFYGETLIPRQYVERHWTRHLELMDFKDDRSFLPQALIVMRKGTA